MNLGLALLVLLSACASQPEPAAAPLPLAASTPPSPGADMLPPDEAAAFCVRLHEQVATCPSEFIDMNLELRAKYFPPFAAKIADPAARAEIQKEGVKETLADGTGPVEARRARCQEYVAHGPPVPRGDVAQAETCFQKASCAEKIACLRPSQEARYTARAKDPSESTPQGAPKMK
jgi:hypothetical protein